MKSENRKNDQPDGADPEGHNFEEDYSDLSPEELPKEESLEPGPEWDPDDWGPWKDVVDRKQQSGRRRSGRRAKWEISRALGGPPPRPKEPISGERPVTAVDLRRRTSEIVAALERNEEMVVSYRGRWVGLLTPLTLVHKDELRRPVTEQRYFGLANQSRRLRGSSDWQRDRRYPPPLLPGQPAEGRATGRRPDQWEDDDPLDDDCAGAPCPV